MFVPSMLGSYLERRVSGASEPHWVTCGVRREQSAHGCQHINSIFAEATMLRARERHGLIQRHTRVFARGFVSQLKVSALSPSACIRTLPASSPAPLPSLFGPQACKTSDGWKRMWPPAGLKPGCDPTSDYSCFPADWLPMYADCWAHDMALQYDAATDAYSEPKGVQFRALGGLDIVCNHHELLPTMPCAAGVATTTREEGVV